MDRVYFFENNPDSWRTAVRTCVSNRANDEDIYYGKNAEGKFYFLPIENLSRAEEKIPTSNVGSGTLKSMLNMTDEEVQEEIDFMAILATRFAK